MSENTSQYKELLELMKNYKLTDEDLKRHRESMITLNEKYEEIERRSRPTLEWLNKPFSSL